MNENNPATQDLRTDLRLLLACQANDEQSHTHDLLNNSICLISLDESVPCIAIKWKRYATSEQLRLVLEEVICMLKQYRITRILGDDTAIPTIHASDQEWIVEEWFPRAIAAGCRAAATKVPDEYFGHLATSSVHAKVPPQLMIRSFNELSDARRWLRSLTPR